jgi:hypothetical protein
MNWTTTPAMYYSMTDDCAKLCIPIHGASENKDCAWYVMNLYWRIRRAIQNRGFYGV